MSKKSSTYRMPNIPWFIVDSMADHCCEIHKTPASETKLFTTLEGVGTGREAEKWRHSEFVLLLYYYTKAQGPIVIIWCCSDLETLLFGTKFKKNWPCMESGSLRKSKNISTKSAFGAITSSRCKRPVVVSAFGLGVTLFLELIRNSVMGFSHLQALPMYSSSQYFQLKIGTSTVTSTKPIRIPESLLNFVVLLELTTAVKRQVFNRLEISS